MAHQLLIGPPALQMAHQALMVHSCLRGLLSVANGPPAVQSDLLAPTGSPVAQLSDLFLCNNGVVVESATQ